MKELIEKKCLLIQKVFHNYTMNPRDVEPMMIALITFIITIALTNLCICIINAVCYSKQFTEKVWDVIDKKDHLIQIKDEVLAISVVSGLQVLYCIILGLLLYCLGEKFCLHITAAVLAVFTLIGVIILLSFIVDHTKSSKQRIIENSLRKVIYDPSMTDDVVINWRKDHNCNTTVTSHCNSEINHFVHKNINDIKVSNLVTLILIVLLIVGIVVSLILLSTINPKKSKHPEVVQPLDGIEDSNSDELDANPVQVNEQTDAEKSRNRDQ